MNIRRSLRRMLGDEAHLMGMLFGVLAFAAILSGLFATPRLGTYDSGKYAKVMEEAGLAYTPQELERGDLCYDRVIEDYAYAHFSYAKLFAPTGSGSIVYPIALVRMLTQPFGLGFSTRMLYLLYAALTGAAVAMIVRGVASIWEGCGMIPGFMLLVLFSDRNLTAYFGSLYETGTLIVALLLFAGCALRGFTYRRGSGMAALLPVAAASVFLLNATARAIVFLPMVLATAVGLVIREKRALRGKRLQGLAVAFLVLCAAYSSARYSMRDPDNTSRAATYHAVFQGILPVSEDAAEILGELGLDASYVQDIGKSYYQDRGDYAHDPKDEDEAERLFSAISAKSVLRWYLTHPVKGMRAVLRGIGGMNATESVWTLAVGQDARTPSRITRDDALADTLLRLTLPQGVAFSLITALLAASWAVGLWVWRGVRGIGERGERWIEPAALASAALCAAAYLPLHYALMGPDSLELDRLVSVFLTVGLWCGLLMAAGRTALAGSIWFRRVYEEDEDDFAQAVVEEWGTRQDRGPGARLIPALRAIVSSRRRTVLAVAALAAIMVCSIQFATPRAGTVNNGDYGRMMDHLGLIWTDEDGDNPDAQAGRGVIEEYAYRADFDPATLTSIKPRYSLIYPASVVRGVCALLGLRFSTWYVSLLMSAVTAACILSIVRDLYARLGRYTLLAGALLCLIFLCESYLVWFNSLFGEGSIFLGVMMLAACCIHLSVAPQGRATPWVFALAFSAMFLTTAKAQMMVALPVVLALFLVFAFYHRPLRIGRLVAYTLACMACTGLIAYKGIRIYADNNDVSERQTVWQALFYGALMIADDPIADMRELGIPTEMAADIGKHAYFPDEDYVISPNSPEFDEAVYGHINSVTMVGYYLKRPAKLLYMLDRLASESQEVYNGFRVYRGEDYSAAHRTVDRWGLWLYWRPMIAFGHFWEYVLVYGAMVVFGAAMLIDRKTSPCNRLLIATFLGIMLIGSLQYPLTGIGNGFADNHKQLFGFMLCHDLLFALGLPVLVMWWARGRIPYVSSAARRLAQRLRGPKTGDG